MANVSALLAQYLSVKSQISYNQLQSTRWSDLQSSMASKLSSQQSAESKWLESYDKAEEKVLNGEEVKAKGQVLNKSGKSADSDTIAYKYAEIMVPEYDPDKLEEYAELDMQYSLMQSTYDTLLEQLEAQGESLKTTLSNGAKDTGMLES